MSDSLTRPTQIIDAHVHFAGDVPETVALLGELGLKLLNVCVVADWTGNWRRLAELYARLAREVPHCFAWCTSFDPPDGRGDYAERVIRRLDADFAAGAVGCKVWRNIGMEVRDAAGRHIMVDDPLFEPIFSHLERTGRTLLMHIGEPRAAWLPLEGNPMADVYVQNPHFHLHHRRGELPAYERLIASRDRVIEHHPKLRVVGAHLGSMEHDAGEIARRFDRYPNLAIDVSARLSSLAMLDQRAVRRLFLDYPDRILFGTDIDQEQPQSTLPAEQRANCHQQLRRACETAFAYFGSAGEVKIRGRRVPGLDLPADVLERFYFANARRWYPPLGCMSP